MFIYRYRFFENYMRKMYRNVLYAWSASFVCCRSAGGRFWTEGEEKKKGFFRVQSWSWAHLFFLMWLSLEAAILPLQHPDCYICVWVVVVLWSAFLYMLRYFKHFFIMVRGISSSVHQKNTHVNNILWTKFKSKIWTPAFALNLWFLTIQRRRPSIIQLPSRRGHYELLMCVLPCPLLSLCLSVCLCISFLRLSFSLLWAAELYCFFWAYIWLHLVLFV